MMKKILGVFLVITMLGLSLLFLSWSGILKIPSGVFSWTSFPHLQSLYLNRKGNQLYKLESYTAAFDAYVKTLEYDPFSSETHLNLGLFYEVQKQPEKAMPSYENAMKYAKDKEMRFFSYFNQAQMLGKEKKVDEALALYEKALEIEPASKETKTNIELLIQMQQQEQQGQGGDSKDEKDQKDQKDPKDNKDQKDGKNKGDQKKDDPKDQKGQDPKDDKNKGDQDKDKKDKEKDQKFGQNKKYQPRPFKGQELSEGDVKKILGEIKQQEQKIRSEYNRKEVKEQPRDKDW